MARVTGPTDRVTQTVILAAGRGVRLAGSDASVPKPLITVGGVPLIAHALAHAAASGCDEAIIVIGHEGARVRAAIEAMIAMTERIAVRFVENPDPTTPNGHSLLVAEPCARERFFLQMVDHLFAEPVLRQLSSPPLDDRTAGRVLVDRAPADLDLSDATKVRLAGDRVTAIGKAIEPWDAIDTGCFLLTPAIFDALKNVPPSEPRTVSAGMRTLAERRALAAGDLRGVRWMDVDTPADRAAAERLLAPQSAGAMGGAPRP
jgi:1L-myo-inositol 1-phosphate cytidylyltransferase